MLQAFGSDISSPCRYVRYPFVHKAEIKVRNVIQ